MKEEISIQEEKKVKAPSIFRLLFRYSRWIGLLILLTVVANALSISVPRLIARAIDTSLSGTVIVEFSMIALLIFFFTYLQNIVQVYVSEKVARDMRSDLIAKISVQSYTSIETMTPAKILTYLTSDVDAIKTFVAMAVSSMISSAFLIVGVSIILLMMNWRLGLAVIGVIPIIAVTFVVVLSKVRKLFTKSQEAIDWLNKVMSENILGAPLIRLLNAKETEYRKFGDANTEAKRVSLEIVGLFASLMPVISFLTNIATLVIVMLGGHFIIQGTMSLGDFTAFNSYLAILIFPILVIGFVSSVIAQAQASYGRIVAVLNAPEEISTGGVVTAQIRGDIDVQNISVAIEEKSILKNISFSIKAGTKTAIIGPTAAGKTQLLYVMTDLLAPSKGRVLFDGRDIKTYNKESLHSQMGLVFQDSALFNLSVRENIAFSDTVNDESLRKAMDTAQIQTFIDALPHKLDTIVSERGTSLSGGQKQRIMLARALALNPSILFLDDFTARVDTATETAIVNNLEKNYPNITLVSVAQKIAAIENYDQILFFMEGELLAQGTHEQLLRTSTEYAQLYQSQRSINQYE